MREIFLDSGTSTKPLRTVLEEMLPCFSEHSYSPFAPYAAHEFEAFKKAYSAIFSFFQADADDHFICTSSVSESYSLLFSSILNLVVKRTGKNHLVISPFEGAALFLSQEAMKREGCTVSTLSEVSEEAFFDAITPQTALVSISLADPVVGAIVDLQCIREACQRRAIFLHVDVSYALGKIPITLDALGADYVTFEGYPLHAPKGVAGLFVRKEAPIEPLFHGEREETFRGGSFSLPLLVGLGKACEEGESTALTYSVETASFRYLFEDLLEKENLGIKFIRKEPRLPHVSVIVFPLVRNEHLLYALTEKKLFASIGGGPFQVIDELLKEYGEPLLDAYSAISFSLSLETTEEDVRAAVRIISETYRALT